MARTLEVAPRIPRKPRVSTNAPTLEQIQLRAYEIFLERGGTPGNEVEDWLRAERELTVPSAPKPRKTARAAKPKAA
jgi:hypothetical protein